MARLSTVNDTRQQQQQQNPQQPHHEADRTSGDRPAAPPSTQPTNNSSRSVLGGSYGPRNNLSSSQHPNVARNYESPKFGSTTPLKSNIAPSSGFVPVNRPAEHPHVEKLLERAEKVPFINKVAARAHDYLQPLRASGPKEQWRTNTNTVDLTHDDEPQIIKKPNVFPQTNRKPFASSTDNRNNAWTNNGVVPNNREHVYSQKPSAYSIPGGGARPGDDATYYGGEYVDSAKTTESIKNLLEGINDDEQVPKRRSKRKKNKAEKKQDKKNDEELAGLLGGTKLSAIEALTRDENEEAVPDPDSGAEAGDEDEEEEEDESYVEGLKVKLLPHQVRGLNFLLNREEGKSRGGILADDMGLGKTIQSIALILCNHHPRYPIAEGSTFSAMTPESKKRATSIPSNVDRGTLVVAPLALLKQWAGELDKRIENSHRLRILVHHGPNRAKDAKKLRGYDVVITTYDVVRSEHAACIGDENDVSPKLVGTFGIKWWRVICDEAHTIKNRLAKVSVATCALRCHFRWCLTGTPMQNNLDELYSLFKFLRVSPLDDLPTWKDQITRPMQQGKGGIAIERLRVILGAVMLRRTKDILKRDGAVDKDGKMVDSGMKLKERTIEKIEETFSPREAEFYENLEQRAEEALDSLMNGFGSVQGGTLAGKNFTSALALLLRLRQACNHPHLCAGKVVKEKGLDIAPSKRSSPKDEDDDELADMLGGLTVEQKKCDICFRQLNRLEVEDGVIHCDDCESSLDKMAKAGKSKKSKKPAKPKRRRRVVLDSDDEDESQAEEGSDTSDESFTSARSDRSGFLDDEAEESLTLESGDERAPVRSKKPNVIDSYDSAGDDLVASTKITTLIKILQREIKAGHKTIVFSQWTSMLNLIEPFLTREGMKFARYDGSMKPDEREDNLAMIRSDGKHTGKFYGVLLCSLKCGALGLNLTAASRVVILEPFWNPFIEEQAIDRVHRIGQVHDVVVYKMTIQHSVEARILELQEKKRELAKAAIEDGDGDIRKTGVTKLSMRELLSLFRRDAEGRVEDDEKYRDLGVKTRVLTAPGQRMPSAAVNQDGRRDREAERERYKKREEPRQEGGGNAFSDRSW